MRLYMGLFCSDCCGVRTRRACFVVRGVRAGSGHSPRHPDETSVDTVRRPSARRQCVKRKVSYILSYIYIWIYREIYRMHRLALMPLMLLGSALRLAPPSLPITSMISDACAAFMCPTEMLPATFTPHQDQRTKAIVMHTARQRKRDGSDTPRDARQGEQTRTRPFSRLSRLLPSEWSEGAMHISCPAWQTKRTLPVSAAAAFCPAAGAGVSPPAGFSSPSMSASPCMLLRALLTTLFRCALPELSYTEPRGFSPSSGLWGGFGDAASPEIPAAGGAPLRSGRGTWRVKV